MRNSHITDEKLAAYIEGTLSAEENAQIENELKESEEMRETLNDLKKTVQLLQNLEDVKAPAQFTESIMSRVREEAQQNKGVFQRLFPELHFRLLVRALAVILLAAISIFIYRAYKPEYDRIRSANPDTVADNEPQVEEAWGDIKIILRSNNVANSDNQVETIIRELGGVILRKQSLDKTILFATLYSEQINELNERLKTLGEVDQQGNSNIATDNIKIRIEIVKGHE